MLQPHVTLFLAKSNFLIDTQEQARLVQAQCVDKISQFILAYAFPLPQYFTCSQSCIYSLLLSFLLPISLRATCPVMPPLGQF